MYGGDVSRYSWERFIRHAVFCTNTQGSALYDSTLGDRELVDQIYSDLREKQSSKAKEDETAEGVYHPPRRGYTRTVESLNDLTDNIVALRAEMGRWPRYQSAKLYAARPMFPGEEARERLDAYNRRQRDLRIARAQGRKVPGD